MPFNLLLIPLLAGFLFLDRAHLFAYSTSLLEKEQLLLRASIAGLTFASVSRLFCWVLMQTPWGTTLALFLHALAPFPFIGTALGALVLSFIARLVVNFLVPLNVAGDWLYHGQRLNQMESLLLRSGLGEPPRRQVSKKMLLWIQACRMVRRIVSYVCDRDASMKPKNLRHYLWGVWHSIGDVRKHSPFPFGDPLAVMLTIKDGRVYVGYVMELPPVTGNDLQFVRVLPIWSGYRRSDTQQVIKVNSYKDAVSGAQDQTTLVKVLPCCDITSANIFENDLFSIKTQRKSRRQRMHGVSTKPNLPRNLGFRHDRSTIR